MKRLKRQAKQRQVPKLPHKLNCLRNNSCYSCSLCKEQSKQIRQLLEGKK